MENKKIASNRNIIKNRDCCVIVFVVIIGYDEYRDIAIADSARQHSLKIFF